MEKSVHIFDSDGVLINSMPFWAKGIYGVFEKRNIAYPADVIKQMAPLGNADKTAYFQSFGISFSSEKEMCDEINALVYPYYEREISLKAGVKAYLERLAREGKRLFVLTASPHLTADVCLKRNGVFELFEKIWSVDDFNVSKSDKRIYQTVCEKLGVQPSDVCFYDDNFFNVQAASNAGLYTVGVFDVSSEDFTDRIKRTANRFITSFQEM